MDEVWKPVRSLGGRYEASNSGIVRYVRLGRIPQGTVNADGYRALTVKVNGKNATRFVHALVMEAFAGPCPPGLQVRHLDGDPLNNRWAPGDTEEEVRAAGGNLFYGTPKENCRDRDEVHGRNGHANKTNCGTCGKPYDEANTYVYPEESQRAGARACRNCVRESGRRHDRMRAEDRNRKRREARAAARDPEILTTGEAADLLEVTTETVRRWATQGLLPFERPRQHMRFRRSDVMKLGATRAR